LLLLLNGTTSFSVPLPSAFTRLRSRELPPCYIHIIYIYIYIACIYTHTQTHPHTHTPTYIHIYIHTHILHTHIHTPHKQHTTSRPRCCPATLRLLCKVVIHMCLHTHTHTHARTHTTPPLQGSHPSQQIPRGASQYPTRHWPDTKNSQTSVP
jgi:hypothetical protein